MDYCCKTHQRSHAGSLGGIAARGIPKKKYKAPKPEKVIAKPTPKKTKEEIIAYHRQWAIEKQKRTKQATPFWANKEAIKELVKHYQDEKVGAVTGEKRIISTNKEGASTAGEGIYWKYESLLKQLDSDFYSVVGAAGELMSYRTSLYKEIPSDSLLDDLMQSMQIAINGYRVIYEKNAWAAETASANVQEELKRKIRISAGAWQSMLRLGKAFNPFHNFKLFFAFISHRVLRWTLAPLSLIILLIVNVKLASNSDSIYFILLVCQLGFYSLALLGWYFENKRIKAKVLFVPYYFFIMNLCVYLGLFRFLKGKQSVSWERAQRA
jgi:cellulose synthase/poly-beta-1,6-N-acetylglucosamine synthase-like glycosyltransferase